MPATSEREPLVTIVTPCLNAERFLDETIRSVLEQDYPNIEYIVMDGGSTDGTLEYSAEIRTEAALGIRARPRRCRRRESWICSR